MSTYCTSPPWYNWVPWDDNELYYTAIEHRSGLSACPVNIIDSVETTAEDPNYPIENLLDSHPKHIWRSTTGFNSASLTCTLTSGTNSLFIFNTNAESVSIFLDDFVDVRWFGGNAWFDDNEWWPETPVDIPSEVVTSGQGNSIGLNFEPLIDNKKCTITLVSPANTSISAGILWAGELVSSNNPQYGMIESQKDYSIIKELSNGATYYKKRDTVRTFSGEAKDCGRNSAGWTDQMLLGVSRDYGLKSMPWFITDLAHSRWCIFGRLAMPMSTTFDSYSRHTLKFNIIEVF